MSSSSGREDAPQVDVSELEIDVAQLEQVDEIVEVKSERALGEQAAGKGSGWAATAWALPGGLWLGFYLIAPLVFIVLVSFWTYSLGARSGFTTSWTLSNYSQILHNGTYWHNMLTSLETSVIAVAACLVFGFPIAYFLVFKVASLRNQIALFIVALAPFWTSFLVRSVAWSYPLMGNQGALNQLLTKIGVSSMDHPLLNLSFSPLSVRLAMIQLYILFMITPLFFTLSQVDRSALEAARDLGANWWRTFREVIVPQTMPGVVIGSIFIFVLTMGEYGTVLVTGGNTVQSVGTIVNSYIQLAVQYPPGAAAAVLLVLALIAGVFVITRFSKLRQEL
jgi:putative spermidine/putrescine transport system permease protein